MKTALGHGKTPLSITECGGTGAPLLLVHGAGADRSRWAQVIPLLTTAFSVFTLDRRGRGVSGDEQDYQLAWEAQDLAAALATLPGKAHLVAHSYGAICAIEAALLSDGLLSLVLYEPPIQTRDGPQQPAGDAVERYRARLAAGDRDYVVRAFLHEVAGMPESEVEKLSASDGWASRLEVAPTIPREMAAEHEYRLSKESLSKLKVPTLMLVGGESPAFIRHGCSAVQESISGAQLVVLAGQGHAAMHTAPALFSDAVIAFCGSH